MDELEFYQLIHTGPEVDSAISSVLGASMDAADPVADADDTALATMAALAQSGGIGDNLLINYDFLRPVNQRGVSTGTVGSFAIDHWKLTDGTLTVGASGLELNGTLTQKLDAAVGFPCTASALLSDGTVIAAEYDDSTQIFTLTATGQTVIAAKLEIGARSTIATVIDGVVVPSRRADYAAEWLKCARYYLTLSTYVRYPVTRIYSGEIDFLIPIPIQMAQKPNLVGTATVYTGNTSASGFTAAVVTNSANALSIRMTKSNHGLTAANSLCLALSTGAALDAES